MGNEEVGDRRKMVIQRGASINKAKMTTFSSMQMLNTNNNICISVLYLYCVHITFILKFIVIVLLVYYYHSQIPKINRTVWQYYVPLLIEFGIEF